MERDGRSTQQENKKNRNKSQTSSEMREKKAVSISRIKLQEPSAPSRELPPELLQHPLPSGKELKLPGCSQARLSALRPGRHSPNNSPILPVLLLGHFLLSLYNHGLDSKRKSHFITGSQSPRGKVLEMSAVCLKKPQRQLMPARIKAFRSPVLYYVL